MTVKHWETPLFLLFVLPSVICGGWASASVAAEPLLTPIADTLLDSGAGRLSAIKPSLIRAPALGASAPMQIPVGEADGDEQRGYILTPAPRMMSDSKHDFSDSALDPVGSPGSAGMLPAAQSPTLSLTDFVSEASALSGPPQQGVMTLHRQYRDAMTEGPPPDHP